MMMNKAIRLAKVLSVIMLVFPVCLLWAQQSEKSRQQQEPSLAETEKWITQTFGDGRHIVYKGFQAVDFDKPDKSDDTQCFMQFSVTDQVDLHLRLLQLVDLADIDPASIKSSEPIHDTVDDSIFTVRDHPYVFVTINTTNNKDSIISYTYWKENGESLKHREMEHLVGFPNIGDAAKVGIAVEPEYAPRFMKALRHAVELCGGKPSTF